MGIFLGKCGDQIHPLSRGDTGNGNVLTLAHHTLLQFCLGTLNIGENLINIPQKDLSLLVQCDAVAGAVKKCYAQLLFQTGDRGTQRRSRDKKRLCCIRDLTGLRHGLKILQLNQFH